MLHELTGREDGLLSLLFPHLSGLDLDRVEDLDGGVKIVAHARLRAGGLPWLRDAVCAGA